MKSFHIDQQFMLFIFLIQILFFFTCLFQDTRYNKVTYTLKGVGPSQFLFDVNPLTGAISLKPNVNLPSRTENEYTVSN